MSKKIKKNFVLDTEEDLHNMKRNRTCPRRLIQSASPKNVWNWIDIFVLKHWTENLIFVSTNIRSFFPQKRGASRGRSRGWGRRVQSERGGRGRRQHSEYQVRGGRRGRGARHPVRSRGGRGQGGNDGNDPAHNSVSFIAFCLN